MLFCDGMCVGVRGLTKVRKKVKILKIVVDDTTFTCLFLRGGDCEEGV